VPGLAASVVGSDGIVWEGHCGTYDGEHPVLEVLGSFNRRAADQGSAGQYDGFAGILRSAGEGSTESTWHLRYGG
jgi:hypothetical protein